MIRRLTAFSQERYAICSFPVKGHSWPSRRRLNRRRTDTLCSIPYMHSKEMNMDRRKLLGVLGASAAGLTGIQAETLLAADDDKKGHAEHLSKCAKICAECANHCESCFHHCATLAAGGQKEHVKSMQLCIDCADFCVSAARIVSRMGPLMGLTCDACAKACDLCAASCEAFPNDKHMTACAKICRDCASECKAMLKHVGRA